MAERPTFREFVVTVLKRSMVDWSGYEGWFALAAYLSVLVLPFLVSGFIERIAGDVVQKIIALMATGWLFLLFIIITPFRMWQEEKYKMSLVEESNAPKFNVNWRFSNSAAELILTNFSGKTINGVEVLLRNYRNADGSAITDTLRSLVSKDGKQTPMSLNPLVPTYFEFARLATTQSGNEVISLLSQDGHAILTGDEVGIKLGVSGADVPAFTVSLRVKVDVAGSLSIESWDTKIPAVGWD